MYRGNERKGGGKHSRAGEGHITTLKETDPKGERRGGGGIERVRKRESSGIFFVFAVQRKRSEKKNVRASTLNRQKRAHEIVSNNNDKVRRQQ